LELTVKREKIQIMPESSKRTVAVTYLTGVGAVILAAGTLDTNWHTEAITPVPWSGIS